MSGKPIPIFTTGLIGVPSTKVNPEPGTVYYSGYTGTVLPERPTFNTPTDDPSGKNPTYHGGIVTPQGVSCHYHHPKY